MASKCTQTVWDDGSRHFRADHPAILGRGRTGKRAGREDDRLSFSFGDPCRFDGRGERLIYCLFASELLLATGESGCGIKWPTIAVSLPMDL